ncbi:MAG: DegV family protein [Atopobiaceae bacterium]|jgi:DegV family protein with EDD domain|nr:DegV family protein [Atopobiaceae bacterium]MCI2174009.1 DegV family protein [Atopobiaceae bacterium]MCI2207901.1 DegV family protein [Atopobiaceae bacterium]
MSKPRPTEEVESADAAPDAKAPDAAARAGHAFRKRATCKIIVDTCADFAPGVAEALGVEVIGFPFVMDDGEHVADLWKSMTPHDFYERVRAGENVTTSAVTPGRFLECFEHAAEEGLPTIYLSFTAALSSSFYAAEQAADMVRESHPGFQIEVIDNLCDSVASELLAIEVVRQAGNGLSFDELVSWTKEARYFLQGYFTLDSFDALARGGRIPPAAAQVGGKLDIKPELSYDLDASLSLKGMCRGRKKALRAILADFHDNWSGDASLPVAIVSADAEKDADWVEEQVRKEPGCSDLAIIRSQCSPVLGAHVGPGMVALTFWGSDRRERVSLTDRIARKVRGGQDAS